MVHDLNWIMWNAMKGNYRYIGSGSSRDVFDLGNGYVAKIAKNKAGIAQNKAETEISMSDASHLFAKVMKTSSDYKLLIMEKAEKVYKFSSILKYFKVRNVDEFFNLNIMQDLYFQYNLILADLNRKSSWGMINGRPVIVDYGFTKKVRKRYY